MVYNHTSSDIKKIADDIRSISKELGVNEKMKMFISDEPIWPLRWYLRDFVNLEKKPDIKNEKPPVIVLDSNDRAKYPRFWENYFLDPQKTKVRVGWYAPTVICLEGKFFDKLLGTFSNYEPDFLSAFYNSEDRPSFNIINYMLFRKPYPDNEDFKKERLITLCFFGVRKDIDAQKPE